MMRSFKTLIAAGSLCVALSTAVYSDDGILGLMKCLSDKGAAIGSAHRGGPAPGYPENALATFARNRRAGVRLFEVDIMRAADGTLYLMHDRTLDRTSTGEGPTNEQPIEKIKEYFLEDNAGALTSYRVPTLKEALAWAKANDSFLNIDLKRYATVDELAAVVMEAAADDRVAVISASLDIAKEAAQKMPRALISVSLTRDQTLKAISATGIPKERIVVWAGFRQLDEDRIMSIVEEGFYVTFGTLGFGNSYDDRFAAAGDNAAYADVARLGVDMIATDRPLAVYDGLANANIAWDSRTICE